MGTVVKWPNGSILAEQEQAMPDLWADKRLDPIGRQLAIQCRAINRALAQGRMEDVRPRQRAMDALAAVSEVRRHSLEAALEEVDAKLGVLQDLKAQALNERRTHEAHVHAFVAATLRALRQELATAWSA